MRLLHTSDWHLGQYFYGKNRAEEHQAFLNWLLEQIDEHDVDALIVSGDLFDTGTPPSYARQLYNSLITRMSPRRCQLILVGGNHDSVAMLNESKGLLAELGTHLVASASGDWQEQLISIPNKNGELAAIVMAVPYLRPRDLIHSSANLDGRQKQQQLQQAISEHYQQLYQQAQILRGERPIPIIATGHLTTVGASRSEAVRELYIGTLDAFPAHAFPTVDYLALGHIHRSQIVASQPHMRYSGSPIPLSFDELNRPKEVLLVEFEQQNMAQVQALPVPTFQAMAQLRGSLAEIEQQLQQFAPNGDTTNSAPSTWLDIEVRSDEYIPDLQGRILTIAAELPVEVLLVRRQKKQNHNSLNTQQHNETLAELTIDEVFARRLAIETWDEECGAQRQQRLQELFKQTAAQLQEQSQ
ncbi:MAG: exonuclease subunit SbcD [Ferrimonas sp.]